MTGGRGSVTGRQGHITDGWGGRTGGQGECSPADRKGTIGGLGHTT